MARAIDTASTRASGEDGDDGQGADLLVEARSRALKCERGAPYVAEDFVDYSEVGWSGGGPFDETRFQQCSTWQIQQPRVLPLHPNHQPDRSIHLICRRVESQRQRLCDLDAHPYGDRGAIICRYVVNGIAGVKHLHLAQALLEDFGRLAIWMATCISVACVGACFDGATRLALSAGDGA